MHTTIKALHTLTLWQNIDFGCTVPSFCFEKLHFLSFRMFKNKFACTPFVGRSYPVRGSDWPDAVIFEIAVLFLYVLEHTCQP